LVPDKNGVRWRGTAQTPATFPAKMSVAIHAEILVPFSASNFPMLRELSRHKSRHQLQVRLNFRWINSH